MAERIRYAVKKMRSEGFSDNQIIGEVIRALQESSNKDNLFKEETSKIVSEKELRREVTSIMKECGIPANILGFNYLRDAIMISIKEPAMVNFITKKLYPEIAEIYGTTQNRVERAMRHAIELAWKRGNAETLKVYFGCTTKSKTGRPTNSEFIAMISDFLNLKFELN